MLLLLLAIGAAMLSVGILHKMKERRVFSILLQEREQQLISLQVLLEKEKEISKEMRRKADELEAKTSILSIERTELKNKVMNSETTTTYLTNTQKELEAALVEKESHINQMKEIAAASGPDQMAAIKELLQQKEAELEEIKTKFQDYKKPDTEVRDNIVLSPSNENTISDTVAVKDSASSDTTTPAPTEELHSDNTSTTSKSNQQDDRTLTGTNKEEVTPDTMIQEEKVISSDSIPATAEEVHSYSTTALESNHQDEKIVAGTNNEDVTPDTVMLKEKENSGVSVPAPAEELQSHNTITSASNHQEDSSSEEQFIKFTTNFEDDGAQQKTGGGSQNPDDTSEGNHSETSELHQSAGSQEVSKEEIDGKRQLEDSQGDATYRSRESKLLEKEEDKEDVRETEKEINPDSGLKTSKDSLSEANQEIVQAVEPVARPADVNPSVSTNNDDTKETTKRHRRRRSRSKRRKRTDVAANNLDGDATANP